MANRWYNTGNQLDGGDHRLVKQKRGTTTDGMEAQNKMA